MIKKVVKNANRLVKRGANPQFLRTKKRQAKRKGRPKTLNAFKKGGGVRKKKKKKKKKRKKRN